MGTFQIGFVLLSLLCVLQRIFTDNDVRVTKNRNAIEKSVAQLIDLATSKGITFPDNNLELVLLMSKRDPATKEKQFYYYIVDMNKRLLFWLSDFDSPRLFQGLKGVKEPTHISKPTCHAFVSSLSDVMVRREGARDSILVCDIHVSVDASWNYRFLVDI